jgi:hypothetical protein
MRQVVIDYRGILIARNSKVRRYEPTPRRLARMAEVKERNRRKPVYRIYAPFFYELIGYRGPDGTMYPPTGNRQ